MDTYLILGTRDSTRRAIVYDLIKRGIDGKSVCAMLSKNETPADINAKLVEAADIIKYESPEDALLKARASDGAYEVCFFFADPSANLASSIENFKTIADTGAFKLIRIIGVIDCALFVSAHPEASAYYDAVSHFSDCIILAKRSGVDGKDVSNIKKRYDQLYRPHTFQLAMNDGKVEKPIEILIDETRRISVYYDDYDPVDELELDEDTLPEEPFTISRKIDPYLELNDRGQFLKPIPNGDDIIAKSKNGQ